MTTDPQTPRTPRFLIGLLAGTVVGAGLAIWLAPRAASELRQRLTAAAEEFRARAMDRHEQVRARIDETVDGLARKGRGARDDMADAVARGARTVEHMATAAKTDHSIDTRPQASGHKPASMPHAL